MAGRAPLLHHCLPLFLAFQLEGACVQQRLLERQELLVFVSNVAGAQPVPVPLPPVVLVGLSGLEGMLAGRAPLLRHASTLSAFQLEGACVQQRLLERQELLVFVQPTCQCPASARTLATRRACRLVWGGGHVGRPCTALAPRLPLFLAFQLEGACVQQRLLERQELLVFGHQRCQCPASARTLATRRACRLSGWRACWQAVHRSCTTPPLFLGLQLEGACVQQLLERQKLGRCANSGRRRS